MYFQLGRVRTYTNFRVRLNHNDILATNVNRSGAVRQQASNCTAKASRNLSVAKDKHKILIKKKSTSDKKHFIEMNSYVGITMV